MQSNVIPCDTQSPPHNCCPRLAKQKTSSKKLMNLIRKRKQMCAREYLRTTTRRSRAVRFCEGSPRANTRRRYNTMNKTRALLQQQRQRRRQRQRQRQQRHARPRTLQSPRLRARRRRVRWRRRASLRCRRERGVWASEARARRRTAARRRSRGAGGRSWASCVCAAFVALVASVAFAAFVAFVAFPAFAAFAEFALCTTTSSAPQRLRHVAMAVVCVQSLRAQHDVRKGQPRDGRRARRLRSPACTAHRHTHTHKYIYILYIYI